MMKTSTHLGDALVVEVDSGDGNLSMSGELVRLQIRKQQQTHRSDDFQDPEEE